ncbi:MAG: glycosyltransferase family 1 protein [Rhodocyclaceae bacterium]
MRVLVDGFYLEKPRGMGRYAQELLNALRVVASAGEVAVTVTVPEHMREESLLFSDVLEYRRGPSLPFPVWEQFYLPWVARKLRPDLIHFPYNTTPLLGWLLGLPYVVTVHDLIFKELSGGSVYQRAGNLYRLIASAWNSKRRCKVITLSEYYVARIQNEMGLAAQRIYTSVDFYRQVPLATDFASPGGAYFVHVGGISPHKNSAACIEAFSSLNLPGVKLVVLGIDAAAQLADRFRSDSVIFPGFVDDATMVAYLRNSLAVLFPSLKEGYGMPIVEAFAFGVPVLVSDLPPMNEIAGEGGLLVDPLDLQSIADGIRALCDDSALRTELAKKGAARYDREMSAQRMGQQVAQVYRRALGLK